MTPDNTWPIEVTILVLDCNISGPYGNLSSEYPNTLNDWVTSSFRSAERFMHANELDWWTIHHRLLKWLSQDPNSSTIVGKRTFDNWNTHVCLLYNVTWALLGYTDGQSQKVLDIVSHLATNDIFQKLSVQVYHNHSNFYSTKDYAKKKASVPVGPRVKQFKRK